MIPSHITNFQRMEFMLKFSAEVLGENALLVEDWEKGFLASWRASSRPSLWFIGKRPECTDKIWRKYALQINLPFPIPPRSASGSPASPTAHADACEFLVRGDLGQFNQPCNAPATLVNRLGFRYCATHGEQAQKAIKRRGGHMELRTYLPKNK